LFPNSTLGELLPPVNVSDQELEWMASINKAIDEKNNPSKGVAESRVVVKEAPLPVESAMLVMTK